MDRIKLRVGDRVRLTLPCSEVMLHMRLAEQVMEVEVLDGSMAQLWQGGEKVSFPVTWGEAGIYSDAEYGPYAYGGNLVGAGYGAN
ncbi:hypothetical protein [Nocardia brasiliensis]|uniref:hypothetical protein n=1 Tax=Nocardia brasiliensis TaxID=37326 RepID=UPI002457FD31|nr:hypothetical protein [Nocardia brasiliensis]